ncbi:tRNA-dihydrouridine synthase B [Escherichia coli]|uniref:tRNA-dihydrouridine synthase B n=1 Tax=Escherichia coli TaxID=562 RepID=A0A377JZ58_ECOLX|nr:tRNA-dihydrouridine synthase B [Escherichia coli]
MMSSNPQVWESDKSRLRMVHIDEPGIRTVQIAGSDPKEMADAARINVESGAQIIDINMGCPAKKVNRKLAGSALLQYPDVVKSILTEVVNAVDVSCYPENSHWLGTGNTVTAKRLPNWLKTVAFRL